MSSLAKFCIDLKIQVTGSDRNKSDMLCELSDLGAFVYQGENADIVNFANIVVFSSAIKDTNQELQRARTLNIRTYERHQFLGLVLSKFASSVAVAGTHGKTSVTSLIASILQKSDRQVVGFVGGETAEFGNYLSKFADYNAIAVTEACEYKRSLLSLVADIGVVTNIDLDHPDCYQSIDDSTDVYNQFLLLAKNFVVSYDDYKKIRKRPAKQKIKIDKKLWFRARKIARQSLTKNVIISKNNVYSVKLLSSSADFDINCNLQDIKHCESSAELGVKINFKSSNNFAGSADFGASDNVCSSADFGASGKMGSCGKLGVGGTIVEFSSVDTCMQIELVINGEYEISNMLFAFAVAHELGVDNEIVADALCTFGGIKRRWEKVLSVSGDTAVDYVFDYAHHPTEIKAVLAVASRCKNPLIIFQPHTFSRTKAYFDDFVDVLSKCDNLCLLPTYGARERQKSGVDSSELCRAIERVSVGQVTLMDNDDSLAEFALCNKNKHDLVLYLGAGDIYKQKQLLLCKCNKSQN